MKKPFVIPALFIVVLLTAGNSWGQPVVRETRNVAGFSEVNFGGSGDLFISFGSGFEVVIEGEKKDIDNIITRVEGEKLNIRKNRNLISNGKITVYITMPELKGLGISGSAKAEIKDALKGEDFDLGVSGSGKVLFAGLDLTNFECSISGSGSVNVSGKGRVESSELSISGSASFNSEAVTIGSFEVAISGSGNCHCSVEKSLEAAISGSGIIIYSGDPKIDAKVSGSGRIRSK